MRPEVGVGWGGKREGMTVISMENVELSPTWGLGPPFHGWASWETSRVLGALGIDLGLWEHSDTYSPQ